MVASFLNELKIAASGPYAFVAYIVLALVAGFLSYRGARLKMYAAALSKIPAGERKSLIEKEYGFHLKEGMGADDFIKAQKNQYIFIFLLLLLAGLSIITVIAIVQFQKRQTKEVLDIRCETIRKAVTGVAGGFRSLRLSVDDDGNGDNKADDVDYTSSITLPGSLGDTIVVDASSKPYYYSYYYYGPNIVQASRAYVRVLNDLTSCLPEWSLVPKSGTSEKKDLTLAAMQLDVSDRDVLVVLNRYSGRKVYIVEALYEPKD